MMNRGGHGYQSRAAVLVICRRPALLGGRGPVPIKHGLGCQSSVGLMYCVTISSKCHQDQSNFSANCISSLFNAARLMFFFFLTYVTRWCFSHRGTVTSIRSAALLFRKENERISDC